jgi:hypothetical protein
MPERLEARTQESLGWFSIGQFAAAAEGRLLPAALLDGDPPVPFRRTSISRGAIYRVKSLIKWSTMPNSAGRGRQEIAIGSQGSACPSTPTHLRRTASTCRSFRTLPIKTSRTSASYSGTAERCWPRSTRRPARLPAPAPTPAPEPKPHDTAERCQVTVMYSDLVGSAAYIRRAAFITHLISQLLAEGKQSAPDTLSRSFMSGALRIEAPTGRHYFGAWIL